MTLQEKLHYVDEVFGFLFNGTFASKFMDEGGAPDVDVSHYEFPDDILSYRQDAIDCIMRERSRQAA